MRLAATIDTAVTGYNTVINRMKELEATPDVKEYLAAQNMLQEFKDSIASHVKETGEIIRTGTHAFNVYKRSNTDWKGFYEFLSGAKRADESDLKPFISETVYVKADVIKHDTEEISL